MPIPTYFMINAMETGQFERTLIVAEERSFVEYVEGCTAPYDTNQLHAAVVELYCREGAKIKYSTVQKAYVGDEQGKGGIYNFLTEVTQVETGSTITWKYPSMVKNPSARVMRVSRKIGKDQLFYFQQRGIDHERVLAAMIFRFCREIFNKLPDEFGAEVNQLIGIKLEGSVG
uniref:SUF system FeS cluster assembly SufBD core domain-containing protein n=1 Tax=Brassica oleracea var. oleracea TaxID=109376 RepID=A0A0D3ASM9_BRAOL